MRRWRGRLLFTDRSYGILSIYKIKCVEFCWWALQSKVLWLLETTPLELIDDDVVVVGKRVANVGTEPAVGRHNRNVYCVCVDGGSDERGLPSLRRWKGEPAASIRSGDPIRIIIAPSTSRRKRCSSASLFWSLVVAFGFCCCISQRVMTLTNDLLFNSIQPTSPCVLFYWYMATTTATTHYTTTTTTTAQIHIFLFYTMCGGYFCIYLYVWNPISIRLGHIKPQPTAHNDSSVVYRTEEIITASKQHNAFTAARY